MKPLTDAIIKWFNSCTDKQRVQQQILLHEQQRIALYNKYRIDYARIANDVTNMLNQIQTKYNCLGYYDIDVVTSAFPYSTDTTMAFYIPFAYMPDSQTYKTIMFAIRNSLRKSIGIVYPQYQSIDVFKSGILTMKLTSYGFDIISLSGSFY